MLTAGVYLGAFVFATGADARLPWLIGVAGSGLLILLLDLHESGAFLLQVRGAVVLAKIVLLLALPWFAPHEAWLLGALILVSVLSSHAPAGVRYRVLAGRGRIRGGTTSG